MDAKIDKLLQWIDKPFISPNIAVKDDATFGRGIYAKGPIKPNFLMISIPHSHLLNFTTVVAHITSYSDTNPYKQIQTPKPLTDIHSRLFKLLKLEDLMKLTSFQLISLFLCIERQRESFWSPFIDTLPDVAASSLNPLVWRFEFKYNELKKWLPQSTRDHADRVYERFKIDYKVVLGLMNEVGEYIGFEDLDKSEAEQTGRKGFTYDFLWAWLAINSRCLYMDIPQAKTNDDKFTLAPYVDFINHSSHDQCKLKIDSHGFHVTTTTSYDTDDQLFLSYGPHSNEFLLCEYGFTVPSNNPWNELDVTNIITELLSNEQKEFLKEVNFYEDYTINIESGLSFRVEVALATLQEVDPKYSRRLSALINGFTDGTVFKSKGKRLLQDILSKVISEAESYLETDHKADTDMKEKYEVIGVLHKNRLEIARKYFMELY